MPFLTEPLYRDLSDGHRAVLMQDLVFTTECGRVRVRVPMGFVTDWASVPRVLWPIFPPRGPWNRAAIVHDFLCVEGDRFLADAIFRVAMRETNVPRWRKLLMYYAVRFYSWWVGGK